MAFWGVEIKSGKPYTLLYDDEKGRLHVSQVGIRFREMLGPQEILTIAIVYLGNLGRMLRDPMMINQRTGWDEIFGCISNIRRCLSKEKTVVVCNVGDKKPIYLCSLFPRTMETCPLNVEFEEFEEVTLSVIGPHSVHLSGYFFGESPDDDGHDCDSDSCEDCGLEGESGSGESFDYDSEDEEDDFSDDDIEMFPSSSAPKSGVRIEEITDDGKPANENALLKRPKKKTNDNSQQQIVLKNAASVPVLESEDEDGFPVSAPAKGGLSSNKEAEKETGANGQLKRKKTKGDSGDTNNAKRKKDDPNDGNQAREPSQPVNLPTATPEVIPKEEAKKPKKSKKKRLREKEAKMLEASKNANQSEAANNQNQAKEKPQDAVADSEMNEKEKKAINKNKKQENAAAAVTNKNELTNEGEKAEAKSSQTRTFPNGLVIEDLQMGKPDGKRAAAGKKVSVRYIGKLKKNGKIFDSNIGKAPFKFRLGVGEVIKGWDIGVNGMRVGNKRRLTIPPAMGYGAKGAAGAIPPNAWLTFDVELVDAN